MEEGTTPFFLSGAELLGPEVTGRILELLDETHTSSPRSKIQTSGTVTALRAVFIDLDSAASDESECVYARIVSIRNLNARNLEIRAK